MARRSLVPQVEIGVEGLAEITRGMKVLAQGRAYTRALDRAAGRVVELARETRFRHAQGPAVQGILTYRTGGLSRSIKVAANRAGVRRGGSAFRDVIFGAGGRHGPLHELGTRRLPRRPVLAPALESLRPELRGIFEDEIAAELRTAGL